MKIVVKDDFLNDPEHAKELAWSRGDFDNCIDKSKWHWNDLKTPEKRDTKYFQNEFSKLLNEDVILVNDMVRKFNICKKRENDLVHIHHDDVDYIGIVYLNEPEDPMDGTAILYHKESGIGFKNEELFGSEVTEKAPKRAFESGLSMPTKLKFDNWETKMFIPMKYNRLVLFEPRYYHTETRVFGETVDAARIVEVFHMIKKENIAYWIDFWKDEIEDHPELLYHAIDQAKELK